MVDVLPPSLRFMDVINDIYNHSDKKSLKELWKNNHRFEGNEWLEPSLYEFLLNETKIKVIIIQLSCFDREPIHFNYKCKCEICDDTTWTPISNFINTYIILKKVVKHTMMNRSFLIIYKKSTKRF